MAGGLTYYIYKNGNIPPNFKFVWKLYFEAKNDDVLIRNLIQNMTRENFEERPSMDCLCYHPYFWNYQKILDFLVNISSRLDVKDSLAIRVSEAIQKHSEFVVEGSWMITLESNVQQELFQRNQINFDGYYIENLIKSIRNCRNNYDQLTASAKETLGSLPDGFTEFWIGKFPRLLQHVYLKCYGLSGEENFKQYYPDPNCDFNDKFE